MGPRQSAQIGELHTQACKMEIIVLKSAQMEIVALWAVLDTIPPIAYVTASTTFTSSSNVSINISFIEPCIGEGFGCKSGNACNLLVYGAGQVVPSSFRILKPSLTYSLVSLSPTVRYSRAILGDNNVI
ncbi:uncharacterized protein LOC131641322 isoform X3 [Vicia villosa]|uniref:uncharacterized protein LOC131641322 isoform X3 n=1 Tax=Vicia villosa TaxID=3911 RepID=UPI00273AC164|nr:uncharacterized protein LOC131641322 isoform X3 [Vicia villosa]